MRSEEELFQETLNTASFYKVIFGKDFYVELQYHGIDREAYAMPLLYKCAKTLEIPTIITNDVHMATKDDLQKRLLNRNAAILSGTWLPAMTGDKELYFKTEEEKKAMLSKILPDDVIEESIENVNRIAEECNVTSLSESKHYPKYRNATNCLRELATEGHTVIVNDLTGDKIELSSDRIGIKARFGDVWNKTCNDRFEYELSVIEKMGFSSYFLFIADIILKCKTMRENATDIGPGRGSGAGSIVCFLCGITEINPMKNGLLFERFLNPERVSMPKQYWAFHVNPITQGC